MHINVSAKLIKARTDEGRVIEMIDRLGPAGSIEIRPISAGQIQALLSLWKDAGLPCRPTGRDRIEHIAREMEEEPRLWLGAWEGERLVGAVFASDDGRKGWINRLAVHPEYRSQGLARVLVERAEEVLRRRGREVLAVLIEDDNPTSMDVFTHLGYVREEHIIYYTKRDRPEA
ncbi:MAG: GNAT family N-acetyltransferase [Thermoplasmata archaeon]|nr:GNAT family N-acetyltransferase [Thermoplasmata archaeon]